MPLLEWDKAEERIFELGCDHGVFYPIVAGAYTNPKPPHGKQVFADAIGLPILANANLAMAVKVL